MITKGYNITVLDNLSEQIHGANSEITSPLYLSIKDNVKFIKGNVCDCCLFSKSIEGQDAIVHLAAETGTGQSMYGIQKYIDINICATALMLDILTNTKHNVKKVVVAASRATYGEGRYFSHEKGYVYPLSRTDNYMSIGDFECHYDGCEKPLELAETDENSKIHPTSVYGITQ